VKVILRGEVPGLGKRGEVVDVSDGYARNYLVPRGLAMRSQPGAEAQAGAMRRSREIRDARERGAAEEIARKLAPMVVRVEARAGGGGEGRLFGSVGPAEISDAVYSQTGFEIDRRIIEVDEPIKTTGLHSVPAKLHSDVKVFLQVEVVGR
jgi:large subunit ribosomal protein L9